MSRLLVAAVAAALVVFAHAPRSAAAICGLPSAAPVWIDYGESSVQPDVRAVLARPGVTVATSGTTVPAEFRANGAATAYFVLKLPQLVGEPASPADPASIPAAAARLLAQAQASTACATPWIALNELLGEGAQPPWSPTTTQYRADVLLLVQQLAAGGAHPVLLVHGNPFVAGTAADWWRQVAQSADLVYEAYYNATNIYALGPVLGNRRMRLGMRLVAASFTGIGIPVARLGFMLGFHSAETPGIGGRQELQPSRSWFRVVKWEALAAQQVAADTRVASIWSWGWGTFGPESVDPDKAAAACVWLWARTASLCDGPAAAGTGFDASLTEGQIALPAGVACSFAGGRILAADVSRLAALVHDRHTALTALFGRASLETAAPVGERQMLAAEKRAIARSFHGSHKAYLRALAKRHATLGMARAIILDELRRRALAAKLGSAKTTLQWVDDREARAAATATCRNDELPGTGGFPQSDALEIGVVPLARHLPFLFADRTAPSAPTALAAAPAAHAVSLSWSYGAEPDLTGYVVYRAAASGGPYKQVAQSSRPAFVDTSAPAGVPSYYVVRGSDTSGNLSAGSAEASAEPS